MQILFALTKAQLALGNSIIIEAPFAYKEDMERFEMWEGEYHLALSLFVLQTGEEERIRRKQDRVRHQSHHDDERLRLSSDPVYTYEHVAHRAVYVDTTHVSPSEVVEKIISSI